MFDLTTSQLLTLFVIVLVLGIIINNYGVNAGYNFPPGPVGLPIVGSLPFIMFHGVDEYMLYLSQKYGGIVTVKFGSFRNIIINDYDIMKEFSINPDFQGRPQIGVEHMLVHGYGLIDSEGNRWKYQRRFVLHALRDSGMGKMQMEDKITHELEIVTNEIAKANGTPLVLDVLLEKATCNVIFGLAFNKTFDYNDPLFISRIQKLNENVQLTAKCFYLALFESLRVFTKQSLNTMEDNINAFQELAGEFICEHRQNLDADNPRDLLDLFLTEMTKDMSPDNLEYQMTFTDKQLKILIIDIFGAGTETTSTTIRWALLYMMHYPEIQRKVQQEIDDVIGENRTPTVSDKSELPFTMATLQEVERLGSVVPRGLPRSNQSSAKFREYIFPERCMFTLNVHAIHRDPKLWDKPEEFKPERFINGDGKVFRPPYLVPFGSGKRSCAGEALARMEVFLFFVTLMQKFTFLPPNGQLPKIVSISGIVRSPVSYKVVCQPRS